MAMIVKSVNYELNMLRQCSTGDMNIIKKTFDGLSKTEIESIKDSQNASCLHYAARNGIVKALDYFINQKNVSPFMVSKVGATFLHDAAVRGEIAVIEWILKYTDMDLSVKDADGATVIHLAAKFDQIELVEWLLRNYSKKEFMKQAYNGATCLHYACITDSFNTLKRLTQAVPSLVNFQMMNGVTALYLAVQEDNFPTVKLLAHAGANVHLKASDGMSPMHVAAQNGNLAIVRYLNEEFDSDLNELDFNGSTPLHFACLKNSVDLVTFLLARNVKIRVDKNGNSPLHDCAENSSIECARLVISRNGNVALRNKENQTCIEIARARGHVKFAEELEKFLNKHEDKMTENVECKLKLEIKKSENKQNVEKACLLKPENTNLESVLSPLNSLVSLKSVPTSTPQDYITIISDSMVQPDMNNDNKEKTDKTDYQTRQLGRNQSLVKIVSQETEANAITPQTTIQCSSKYLKRSESLQSETLAELNNCIAQFEKFSYYTEESFKNEKDLKLDEISIKLNEIKNTLIETKNKQIVKSQSSVAVSLETTVTDTKIFTENSSDTDSMISDINTPSAKDNESSILQDKCTSIPQAPPPPPPPMPENFLTSNNFKASAFKAPVKKSTSTEKDIGTLKSSSSSGTLKSSSSSSSFMNELQRKLKSKSSLRKTESTKCKNDSNNNCSSGIDLNLNANNTDALKLDEGSAGELKKISMQRLRQDDIPEWKKRLIEKKRMNKADMW